jgi:hypothetical protein
VLEALATWLASPERFELEAVLIVGSIGLSIMLLLSSALANWVDRARRPPRPATRVAPPQLSDPSQEEWQE